VTIEENGIAQLALLLPGGKGLQAMGYRGGILSRAVPLGSAVPQSSKPILTPSPVQTQTSPNAPSPDFKEEITGLKGTNRWLMLEVQRLLTTVAQLQAQVNTLQGRYNNLEGTYSNHQHKYEDSSLPANMLVTIARLRSLMNDKSSNVDHWGFYIFGPPPPKRPVEKFTDKPKN